MGMGPRPPCGVDGGGEYRSRPVVLPAAPPVVWTGGGRVTQSGCGAPRRPPVVWTGVLDDRNGC